MIHRHPSAALVILALLAALSACTAKPDIARGQSIELNSISESNVSVSIHLERTPEGTFLLHATFSPPEGDHLYGKDLPKAGLEGLGRPTLLELTAESKMLALGALMESVPVLLELFELIALPVYPAGPVTLSLPVSLPPGKGWVEDLVSVSFMTCNDNGCKPPVLGKIISVRVPGADSISK